MKTVAGIKFPDIQLYKKGKVRDMYNFGTKLLIIATDRISAFDCVFPIGIPEKGEILNSISTFWFNLTKHIIPNHLITTDISRFPPAMRKYENLLKGRSMLVKKAKVIPVECIVRGYLSGSGWLEYKEKGSICGIKLAPKLAESAELKEPIFTPTTKSTIGHDKPLTYLELEEFVGKSTANFLRSKSIEIYKFAQKYAETCGIIIADTKFEFGTTNNEIILVDELLTPDSSRFWALEDYKIGRPQKNFDKQFIRDYLESSGWNKEPPAPQLPPEIVTKTSEKYLEAKRRLFHQ